MTRAIMNGCNGKMGQCITGICAQDEDIEIVAGIDTYDGIKNDYPVFASLKECTVDADVIIDFSNAKAVDALLAYGVEKQIPIVLCTTGLSEQQLADVEKAYEKVAILKSANMSLGINTLMELLKKAMHKLEIALKDAGIKAEVSGRRKHIYSIYRKLNIKKSAPCKEQIKKYSRNFDGTLTDAECIKLIGIARNTYYKYKRELLDKI
mgnify:CR=1 FL=1